jgi:hypothetical protein
MGSDGVVNEEMAIEPEVDLASRLCVARFRAARNHWRCERIPGGRRFRTRLDLRTRGLRKRACHAIRGRERKRGLGASREGRGGRSRLDRRFFYWEFFELHGRRRRLRFRKPRRRRNRVPHPQ